MGTSSSSSPGMIEEHPEESSKRMVKAQLKKILRELFIG
jgi:hypothetical protein